MKKIGGRRDFFEIKRGLFFEKKVGEEIFSRKKGAKIFFEKKETFYDDILKIKLSVFKKMRPKLNFVGSSYLGVFIGASYIRVIFTTLCKRLFWEE